MKLNWFAAAALVTAPTLRTTASQISIDDWEFGTAVRVTGIGNQTVLHSTPQNNFSESFLATAGNSTAFSSVTTSWDAAGFFDFLIEGEHVNQGNSTLAYARSTGSIFLSPQVDSFLSISGTYNYMLASGFRDAILGVSVSQEGVSPPLLRDFQVRSSLIHPPVGQMTHQTDGLPLFAGVNYVLGYQMSLTSTTGSASSLSLGDGFVEFHITPIPEPTTFGMLAMAAPFALLRRRKCVNRG